MKDKKHPCQDEDGEFDHDWRWVSDFEGDTGVINGTNDLSHWVCRVCEEEDNQRGPPDYGDDSFDDSLDFNDLSDLVPTWGRCNREPRHIE